MKELKGMGKKEYEVLQPTDNKHRLLSVVDEYKLLGILTDADIRKMLL